MAGIDEARAFIAVNIAVLTVSDSRTAADDTSGDILVKRLGEAGHNLAGRAIVRDDHGDIVAQLERWIGDPGRAKR